MISPKRVSVLTAAITLGLASPSFAEDSVGTNFLLGQSPAPVSQQAPKSAAAHIASREAGANTLALPNPILATGSNLKSDSLSPNAMSLAIQLDLVDAFASLPKLKRLAESGSVQDRLNYFEAREHISEVLRGAEMDINYVLAEIYDEQALYNELIVAYSAERDRTMAKTNAISFGTNGLLWALCESLAIPTVTRSNYAISSGISGILAGIIPSVASAVAMKQVNGSKHSEPAAANMLAKIFDRPVNPELEYPSSVWQFLDSAPADNKNEKRKDLIVDRWIADSNIPAFTDRNSKVQIDTLTAATKQEKTITISVLSGRVSMLSQLASEVGKMNRLLNEMEMALRGEKFVDTELAVSKNSETH